MAAPAIDPSFLGAEKDMAAMLAGVRATRNIMRQTALSEAGEKGGAAT